MFPLHRRDRLSEDDTVGVSFLSLSLISATGESGEPFFSFPACFGVFRSLCSQSSSFVVKCGSALKRDEAFAMAPDVATLHVCS